jgi:hypothetical protein
MYNEKKWKEVEELLNKSWENLGEVKDIIDEMEEMVHKTKVKEENPLIFQ